MFAEGDMMLAINTNYGSCSVRYPKKLSFTGTSPEQLSHARGWLLAQFRAHAACSNFSDVLFYVQKFLVSFTLWNMLAAGAGFFCQPHLLIVLFLDLWSILDTGINSGDFVVSRFLSAAVWERVKTKGL